MLQNFSAKPASFCFRPSVMVVRQIVSPVLLRQPQMPVHGFASQLRRAVERCFPFRHVQPRSVHLQQISFITIYNLDRQSFFIQYFSDWVHGRIELRNAFLPVDVRPELVEQHLLFDDRSPVMQQKGEYFLPLDRFPANRHLLSSSLLHLQGAKTAKEASPSLQDARWLRRPAFEKPLDRFLQAVVLNRL
ncbi:hypothetical protein [Brevibacillus agri]|uniref:hypothetical protein n=1 Tax=Brevibacillus agri TaxID=51101 RepID=UPI002E22F9CE|nr:hypothetical protein [Brevibacillus agri]